MIRASVVASNTKQESNTVKLTTYLLTSLASLHILKFQKITSKLFTKLYCFHVLICWGYFYEFVYTYTEWSIENGYGFEKNHCLSSLIRGKSLFVQDLR